MRLSKSHLKKCVKIKDNLFPRSEIKIFRKNAEVKPSTTVASAVVSDNKLSTEVQPKAEVGSDNKLNADVRAKPEKNTSSEYRENEIKIQMLSKSLYQQIFKNSPLRKSADDNLIESYTKDLLKHGIKAGESPKIPDIQLKLPPFEGKDIEEHFLKIATDQSGCYLKLINSLCDMEDVPEMPSEWSMSTGWTFYHKNGPRSVPYPNETAMVFDIEVCMKAGSAPTLACALGTNGWYSWVSPHLFDDTTSTMEDRKYYQNDLIPMESTSIQSGNSLNDHMKTPKIIVGHNVSFDRARIKEQYWLNNTGTRFLDTMSLHVCVSGVTSYQRAMLKANKEMEDDDLAWSSVSSLNSLLEVYKLYCNGATLDKEQRNLFFEGELSDIRENFQSLVKYCATDVLATHSVLKNLFPLYKERFPHPATLAGMLEIGMAYLPVNSNWHRYINEANLTFEDLNIEAKYLLERRANEACRLMHNQSFKNDLWMWDQDWSTQKLKFNKGKPTKKTKQVDATEINESPALPPKTEEEEMDEDFLKLCSKFSHLIEKVKQLPVKRPLLPGYPAWYRKLCEKSTEKDWVPGPCNIGTGMQVAPKLLSLCWEGYPLHYIRGHGWGFLVPFKSSSEEDEVDSQIPLKKLIAKCPVVDTNTTASSAESDEAFWTLSKDVEVSLSKKDYYRKKKVDHTQGLYTGTGIWCDVELDGCCWFLKLPHKNGDAYKVGNPLARDFLNKFSENVLSGDGVTAEEVIKIARMLSYWRNNRDRIVAQMVVWSQRDRRLKNRMEFGAIIPQVVVCGTLTRRAMEPTWMTASNAQKERIGSELRGMVQAPPGYKFVGADVDSQELWIASVLGDADATGIHGATPLGWMTLSGSKSDGTDMHSVTAKAIGISRDHAKVINYARIYGAGQMFAERLLKQFNPTISDGEAKSKAFKMFAMTKGKKVFHLKEEFREDFIHKAYSKYDAQKVAAANKKTVKEMFEEGQWIGGSESAMFNRLEHISEMMQPVTPFLQCRLSRALEPQPDSEDRFLPTRVNWVVQSGAVDFLHLMLVCMRWLMGPNVRFCLSFHDEIRYLVRDEYAYNAALAMHITNLLTRSFCSKRIGLCDLPQSIAFFTSVEVDTVLRKESHLDCVTPSNVHGLSGGYGIPSGESLNVSQAIEKAGGMDLTQWDWHKSKNE
ncbi:DNA polymerase subunit gamma-1, mitochondrial [Bradysia coprophila]|uniref:DNA polymerase subunit gamma-1, mitochondrial n=1 Tax=Bradysia coprophila TaxID=38358 RepID=UPI00187D85D2|nr:DNA polymerase subunit gamma-1, mitochondrial [Bradysia coprophila]